MSTVLFALAISAATPPTSVVEFSAVEEAQLALSAAPAHLKAGAGVYRLASNGYEAVRPSSNGYNCLVARGPNRATAPLCFDHEGSETTLKQELLRGRWIRQGKNDDEIEKLTKEAYDRGELIAPRRAGIAYMLSTHFAQINPKTGKTECVFPPHVMIYAPYLKNTDVGSEEQFGSTEVPWVHNEGRPDAYILVVQHGADVKACN